MMLSLGHRLRCPDIYTEKGQADVACPFLEHIMQHTTVLHDVEKLLLTLRRHTYTPAPFVA